MKALRLFVVFCLLLVAGCTNSSKSDSSRQTTNPGTVGSNGGVVELGNGVQLRIPAGAVTSPTLVKVKRAEPRMALPDGVSGEIYEVTLDGSLNKPVEVVMTVDPQDLEAGTADFVGYDGTKSGAEFVEAKARSQGRLRAFSAESVSTLGFLRVDGASLRKQLKTFMEAYFGGAVTDPTDPQCAEADKAKSDGWTVTSSDGERIKWCLGLENGKRVLEVANTRRYPQTVSVSSGGTLLRRSDQALAGWLSDLTLGPETISLAGADTAAFTLAPAEGKDVVVAAEFDGLAHALTSIEVSTEWLALFAVKFGGANPSKSATGLREAIQSSGCLKPLLQNAAGAKEFDSADGFELLAGCLDYDTLKGVFGAGLAAVVVLPVGLVFGTGDYFRGSFQSLADSLKDPYRIKVARAAPTGPQNCADYGGQDWGGPFKVVATGLGCAEAKRILDGYFYDTPHKQGSSAFGDFEGWTCFIDNVLAEGWSHGSCERGPGELIEYSSEAYAQPPESESMTVIRRFLDAWNSGDAWSAYTSGSLNTGNFPQQFVSDSGIQCSLHGDGVTRQCIFSDATGRQWYALLSGSPLLIDWIAQYAAGG